MSEATLSLIIGLAEVAGCCLGVVVWLRLCYPPRGPWWRP